MEQTEESLELTVTTSNESSQTAILAEMSSLAAFAVMRGKKLLEEDEWRFNTEEKAQQAIDDIRRRIHGRMIPVSVSAEGKIRINEKAMLPEHEYCIQIGDEQYQFVKRADGVVVMYEVV